MLNFISGFITGCCVTVIVPLFLLIVVAVAGGREGSSSVSAEQGQSIRKGGYNETIPNGMSKEESNYIGNTAKEYGYTDEEDAKKIRHALHKFNEVQNEK